jgi:hypothetical protein
MNTPLHPKAERQARLAKYTITGAFDESRLRALNSMVRLGMMSVAEMWAKLYER